MAQRPKRDWITSEEAAQMIGVSSARFRQFLEPSFREKVFPNSVLITRTWLHYIKDVQKFIAKREKDPPIRGRVRLPNLPGARRKAKPKEPANTADNSTGTNQQ